MAATSLKMPLHEKIIDPRTGVMSRAWIAWFDEYVKQLQEKEILNVENNSILANFVASIDDLRNQQEAQNASLFFSEFDKLRSEQETNQAAYGLSELRELGGYLNYSERQNILHRLESLEKQILSINEYRTPSLPFYLGQSVEFEADGTLRFKNDATTWDDVLPSGVSVALGSSAPSFTAYGSSNLKAYEFVGISNAKNIHMVFQIPHKYLEESTIVPHLHLFIPDDGTGGDIRFTCEYQWSDIGDTGALGTTTATGIETIGASAGIYQNKILSFGNIAGTGKGISSLLQCLIERDPTDVADTFGSSVWLLSADVHCELDTTGSRTATAK